MSHEKYLTFAYELEGEVFGYIWKKLQSWQKQANLASVKTHKSKNVEIPHLH